MVNADVDYQNFYSLLGHPKVSVCFGEKGSGKTALSMRVADDFEAEGIQTVFMPSKNVKHLVPTWMKVVNPRVPRWIYNSFTIIDDIHLEYHARNWRVDKAVVFDKILSVSRHNELSVFVTTTHSHRADVNIYRDADNFLTKKPSKRKVKFERSELKGFFEDALKEFRKKVKGKDPRKYVYVSLYNDTEALVGEYNIPEWFTKELSTYLRIRQRQRQ